MAAHIDLVIDVISWASDHWYRLVVHHKSGGLAGRTCGHEVHRLRSDQHRSADETPSWHSAFTVDRTDQHSAASS